MSMQPAAPTQWSVFMHSEAKTYIYFFAAFGVTFVGILLSKIYLFGGAFFLGVIVSFTPFIIVIIMAIARPKLVGAPLSHLSQCIIMGNDLTYRWPPELYFTEIESHPLPIIYAGGIMQFETLVNLDKAVDFSQVVNQDNEKWYPGSEISRYVIFKHFGTWESRVHLHGELATFENFPFWHSRSETIYTKALPSDEFTTSQGEMIRAPTFEILYTQFNDGKLIAKWNKQVWQAINMCEEKERKIQVESFARSR